jgi:hypothetical protein
VGHRSRGPAGADRAGPAHGLTFTHKCLWAQMSVGRKSGSAFRRRCIRTVLFWWRSSMRPGPRDHRSFRQTASKIVGFCVGSRASVTEVGGGAALFRPTHLDKCGLAVSVRCRLTGNDPHMVGLRCCWGIPQPGEWRRRECRIGYQQRVEFSKLRRGKVRQQSICSPTENSAPRTAGGVLSPRPLREPPRARDSVSQP